MGRIPVSGSQFYVLATKPNTLEPSGEFGPEMSLMASWMKKLDAAMARGNAFEDEAMNPILDWVQEQTGVIIHRKTEFSGNLYGVEVSGHPDWVFQWKDGSVTVIDAKRGHQHENTAYWFQPGLYGKAIQEGLIGSIGKRRVESIGTTFFGNDAAIQMQRLADDVKAGRVDQREAALKVLDAITGRGSSPELSHVNSKVSAPLSDATLQSAVGSVDRYNQAVYDLLGKSPKDLFETAAPSTWDEQTLQKQQRQRLEETVKLYLQGVYTTDRAKEVVSNILNKTGGRVLGDPKSANQASSQNPKRQEYIFFDIETGGFAEDYNGHGNVPIVSFGYQIFDADFNPVGQKTKWIVNDSALAARNLDAFIRSQKVHGTSLAEMQRSPHTLSSLMPQIQALMQNRIPSGYNIDGFDLKILAARGLRIDGPTNDVLKRVEQRYGHRASLENAYRQEINKSYQESHNDPAQDAYDSAMLDKVLRGIGTGMNPANPDFGNVYQFSGWQAAPTDLMNRLGNGAQAKVSPDGKQLALHDASGNVFFIGRLANTSSGWTINGKALNPVQASGTLSGNPIGFQDLYEEVLRAYGAGGPQGVRKAQKTWYEGVKNMTVVNSWSFLSPARAAQIRSAAVRAESSESPVEWYKHMRATAEEIGDPSIKNFVYRSMDSRFMFDVLKTVAASPLTMVKNGMAYFGSGKTVKSVQQMAREQAMSTDQARNMASMFRKPGEGIEYGVMMEAMEAGFLPEGAAYALDRVGFYQPAQKYVQNEDEHDIEIIPRHERSIRLSPYGKYEVAIGRDKSDDELLWVQADNADEVQQVELRKGRNGKSEIGYVLVRQGATTGGQVKFWHNKATLAELNRQELNIKTGYANQIELLTNLPKNPRLAANAILSAEFNNLREGELINLIAAEMSGKRPVLIPVTQEDIRDARRHNVDLSRRQFFIDTSDEATQVAIGKVYAKFRQQRRTETGPTSIDFPLDFMYYKALRMTYDEHGVNAGFSIPLLSDAEMVDWERNASQARQMRITVHDPMISKALHFATVLNKEGTASIPMELVSVLFDKYGGKTGRRLAGFSERDRAPYQEILRTQVATMGEIPAERLTEGGRQMLTLSDLRQKIDLSGNFMAQLKHVLGNNYLVVDEGSKGKFYLSGEALQFIATPNALDRMKKNIWNQKDEEDDEDSEQEVYDAYNAVNSTIKSLKWLLKANDSSQRVNAADRLRDTMFGKEGLANMKGIMRAATGMVFPARYAAQGTVTAVPGMAMNEILLSDEILRRWFPNIGMAEINSVVGGINRDAVSAALNGDTGLHVLAQRYPNIASAITALPAFRVVSEQELISRKGYARQRGFTGIGMSQFSMETIFGDFDGDQVAAFLATVYHIGKNPTSGDENPHIMGVENDPIISKLASFPGRMEHLAKSIGIMTGDDRFISGKVSVSEIMERMKELGTNTNISEIGKWMKSFERMSLGDEMEGDLPKGWNESLSIDKIREQYQSNAFGKRQMGSTYNRMVRDLGIASEGLLSGLEGEVESARDPRAWVERMRVMVHQLSVDMLPLGDSLSMYMEMTERFNPFSKGGGVVNDERTGRKFEGNFEQAAWKIVELILGGSTEMRGVGGDKTSDLEINQAWRHDMARGITNDKESLEKIEALIGEYSVGDLKNQAKIKELAGRVKSDVFGGNLDTLLGNAGGMVSVPVSTWLSKGQRSGSPSFNNVTGGLSTGKKTWVESLVEAGNQMGKFRKAAQGDRGFEDLRELFDSVKGGAKGIALKIFQSIKESAPYGRPNKDAWLKTILANVTPDDFSALSFLDKLVNEHKVQNYQEAMDLLDFAVQSVVNEQEGGPLFGNMDAGRRQKWQGAFEKQQGFLQKNEGKRAFGALVNGAQAGSSQFQGGVDRPVNSKSWADVIPHGARVSIDASTGNGFLIPNEPRMLRDQEKDFFRNVILGGSRLTEDERAQIIAHGDELGISGDLVELQRKKQTGKFTTSDLNSFRFKYANRDNAVENGISSDDMLSLFGTSQSRFENKYGSQFMRMMNMSATDLAGINLGELVMNRGLTKEGVTAVTDIAGGKGQSTVMGIIQSLVDEGEGEMAAEVSRKFFGNRQDIAADKMMAKGDRVIARNRRGLPDPNYRPTEIDEILKHADAVVASKRSDMPQSNIAEESGAVRPTQSAKFADAGDLISRADDILKATRRDPGKRYESDYNPLVARGFISLAESGKFGESHLARAMEMYSNGTLDAKSFDAIASYAGVSGAGGLRSRVDAARRTNEPGELKGALQGIASESNIGTAGAIERANEALKKFGGTATVVTRNFEGADGAVSKFSKLVEDLSSGTYTRDTSKEKRQEDRGTYKSSLALWNAISGAGDVYANGAAIGLSRGQVDQMQGAFEGPGRMVNDALLGTSGGKYAGMSGLGKAGAILKELTSGFELFNLRREWEMTGGQVFGQFIPAAAKTGMAAYQASTAYAGGAAGAPTGTAGGLLSSQAGWSRVFSQAGDDAFQRYGWAMNAGQGLVGGMGGAVLPAIGAGAVTGNLLTMAAGAFPTLGPLALPVGLGVAGLTLLGGDLSKSQAMSSPTAENQLREAMMYRQQGVDPRTGTRQMVIGTDPIFFPRNTQQLAQTGYAPSQMTLGQMSREAPQFTTEAIKRIAKSLSEQEGTIFNKMDPAQISQVLQESAAWDPSARNLRLAALGEQQQFTPYQQYSTITGRKADQFQGLAQNMGMGPNGAAMLFSMFAKSPDLQDAMSWRQGQERLGFYSPLAQWGVSPLQMLSMPDLAGAQNFAMQNFMQGNQRYVSRVARGKLALGDLAPDVAESYRAMMTEESTGLPVGATQESIRGGYLSQNAYNIARSKLGYDLGGGMFQPAALGNLQSEAFYTNAIRNQEQFYQQQQFGFSRQTLQRNIDYTMGRPAIAAGYGANGQYNPGQEALTGSFGFQEQELGLSLGHTRRMATIQAGTLNFAYNGSGQIAIATGGLAGLQSLLGAGGALGGASLQQLGQAGTQYRAFYEDVANQRAQVGLTRQWGIEDAWRQYQRGNIQLNWQAQDLGINFGRQNIQSNWALQDLSINYGRTQTQQGWQAQDINMNANRQSLNYGWNMEDLELQMRYATGRERRQLGRQMERATISYGMDTTQTDREMERLKERSKWNDEDFAKETSRVELRRSWNEADFNREMERIGVRRTWLDEDLARSLERLGQQAKLEDESFALRIKHFEEDMTWQKILHTENLSYSLDMAGIQAKQLAENKKQALENFAQETKMQEASVANWTILTKLQTNLSMVATTGNTQVELFAKNWGDPNGLMAKAMNDFVDNFRASLLSPDTGMIGVVDELIKRLKDGLSGVYNNMSSGAPFQ